MDGCGVLFVGFVRLRVDMEKGKNTKHMLRRA